MYGCNSFSGQKPVPSTVRCQINDKNVVGNHSLSVSPLDNLWCLAAPHTKSAGEHVSNKRQLLVQTKTGARSKLCKGLSRGRAAYMNILRRGPTMA